MSQLKQLLEKLHLSEERGVIVLEKSQSWYDIDVFSFDIKEQLQNIKPTAVYHFNNKPFILFFDKSIQLKQLQKEDNQIFKEVWSWDTVPLVFILYPESQKVFNAFHYQKEQDSLAEIQLNSDEDYEKFSFWNLQSGKTWEWLEQTFYKKGNKNILKKQRVSHKLFENIKHARTYLEQSFNYPTFINILLLRLIFIRYLIDREVEIEAHFIRGSSKKERRDSFNQLIGDGQRLIEFFNYLKDRFNGNLFETETDPDIPDFVFKTLKSFFSDEFSIDSKQTSLFYFDIFDFSVIPVEVISGIYESVIDPIKRQEDSAVYTPLFLVDYILTKTVDKHLSEKKVPCKVLDPSCGSGIFLTQTYRRIIESEKQKGIAITDDKLKTIAEQYIFGIDRDINALNVAAFSIYISILDYKNPKEIKNFQLPSLIGKNLFRNDFFNEDDNITVIDGLITHPFNQKLKQEDLDFIIGNPPWGRKNNKKLDKFHLGYAKKMGNLLSNFEISQSFLIRVKDFSHLNTQCSLIVSSRAFYNAGSKKFKEYFFDKFIAKSILDLSAARRMVFQDANAPCIVVVYKFAFFEQTATNLVEHASIRPNRFLKNYKTIVIGGDEIKALPQNYFKDYHWIFKVALFGNVFDFQLLKRLLSLETIGDILEKNKNKIHKGKGIFKGTPKNYFEFLVDLPLIEAKEVTRFYAQINENFTLLKKEDTFLEAGRTLELFQGNHILLKQRTKNESDLVITFLKNSVVFKNSLYGISSVSNDFLLKSLYGKLVSNLSTYFLFLSSSSWGVSTRPEITLEEYLAFPYIKTGQNFIDYVNTFIEIYKEYYSSTLRSLTPPNPNNLPSFKAINQIINEIYEISPMEEDLIDYVLNVSRYQFQESKLDKFLRSPKIEELKSYAAVFYDYYSTVYNDYGEYFQIEIFPLKHFTAMKFNIISENPSENKRIVINQKNISEKELFKILANNLSIYQLSSDIFIQKNIKGYEDDFFYIIKPNEYKCWHRAIAHHDLAEFKQEMMLAERELMNETYG